MSGNGNGNGKAKKVTLAVLAGAAAVSAAAKAGAWGWDKAKDAIAAELALHDTVAAHAQELKGHGARLDALEVRQPLPRETAEKLIRLMEAEARARERRGR